MASKDNIQYVLKRSSFGAFRQSMRYFKEHDDQLYEIHLTDSTSDSRQTMYTDDRRSCDESDNGLSNHLSTRRTTRGHPEATRDQMELCLMSCTTESENFSNIDYSDSAFSNEVTLVGVDSNFSVDLRRQLAAITKKVEVFSEQHECLKFIATCGMKSVFLVWMDMWSQKIESYISNYHQIICIYALQGQPSSSQFSWEEPYEEEILFDCGHNKGLSKESAVQRKITNEIDFPQVIINNDDIVERSIERNAGPVTIFGSRASMLEQVKQDISLWHSNQTSCGFVSTDNLDREQQFSQDVSTDYSWYRILTDVVLCMPTDSDDRYCEMMQLCRSIYENQNNQAQLKIVDQFAKSYDAEKALWWYSGQSFLYLVLNRALRTGNIDIILKFRSIIQDIHRQLQNLQSKYPYKLVTLYRGHLVTNNELDRLKKSVGKVISFYGFTSTTRNRDIAIIFSGEGNARPQRESILYEITIPEEDTSQCVYADITDISQISNEYETLFSFNSTFRVVNVEEATDYTVVKLVVANDSHELRKLVEDNAESSVGNNRSYDDLVGSGNELMLADRLSDKGDYEQALLYYRTSKNSYLSEDDLAMLYNNSGCLFERRGDYSAALAEYQKALNFHKKLIDQNPHRQAIIYANIGLIYYELENPDAAKYNLNYSLKLKREASNPVIEPSSIAKTLNSLALIDHKFGEYDLALPIYEEALQEVHKSKLDTKPLKATILSNIAHVNIGKNHYQLAIEKFEEALLIRTKFLPSTHPDIAWSHVQIGLVFERIGDYFRADEHYNTAGDIQTKYLPTNHPDLAIMYTRQGAIKSMYGSPMEACELYEKALKILNGMFPYKKAEIATIYNDRGRVYKQQNDISRAQKDFETALRLFKGCGHSKHPCLRKIYGNLADLQYSQQDYGKALSNYNKAIEIGRKTLSDDDPELKSYEELADLVRLHIPDAPAQPISHPDVVSLIKDIINNHTLIFIVILVPIIYSLLATIVLLGKYF